MNSGDTRGGTNALLRVILRAHRGMSEEHQKRAIEWFGRGRPMGQKRLVRTHITGQGRTHILSCSPWIGHGKNGPGLLPGTVLPVTPAGFEPALPP